MSWSGRAQVVLFRRCCCSGLLLWLRSTVASVCSLAPAKEIDVQSSGATTTTCQSIRAPSESLPGRPGTGFGTRSSFPCHVQSERSKESPPASCLFRGSGLRVHNWAFIHHEFYLYRKRIQQEAKFKMTGRMREPNLEKSTLDGANTLRYSCQAMSILMDVPSRAARTDVFRYFA